MAAYPLSKISELSLSRTGRPLSIELAFIYAQNVTRYLNYGSAKQVGESLMPSPPLRIRDQEKSVVLTLDDNSKAMMPDDFLEARGLVGDQGTIVTAKSVQEFEHEKGLYENLEYGNIGSEAIYSAVNNEIEVFNKVREGESYRLVYFSTLGDYTVAESNNTPNVGTNWVAENMPEIYLSGVIAQMMGSVRDEGSVARYWQNFTGQVSSLNITRSVEAIRRASPSVEAFAPMGG